MNRRSKCRRGVDEKEVKRERWREKVEGYVSVCRGVRVSGQQRSAVAAMQSGPQESRGTVCVGIRAAEIGKRPDLAPLSVYDSLYVLWSPVSSPLAVHPLHQGFPHGGTCTRGYFRWYAATLKKSVKNTSERKHWSIYFF